MKYEYRDTEFTIKELSEMSGIPAPTIRARLRSGYSLEEALQPIPLDEGVAAFAESSWWEDWLGKTVEEVHKTYWRWCVSNGYRPFAKIPFMKQVLSIYPQLYTVPNRTHDGNKRVIRKRY